MSQNGPVTRDTLYEEVWANPMTKVAESYGVSSSYLARVCTRMNVPRPERGYWAKLAVGKAPKQPPLPDERPGDVLEWSRDGEPMRAPRLPPQAPKKNPSSKRRLTCTNRANTHRLLAGARGHFEIARENDDGYLKPQKKLLVDLIVSKGSLIRGLSMVNDLLLALEDRGHHVVIAPHGESFIRKVVDPREMEGKTQYHPSLWRPLRSTVVYVGTVAIGLTMFELAESVEVRWINGKYVPVSKLPITMRKQYAHTCSWNHVRDLPSGRLCVQAYSPYHGTDWHRQWCESKAGKFPAKFRTIARELEQVAATIAKLVQQAEHRAKLEKQRWEEIQEKWRDEETERRRIKALKDSRDELHEIIGAWGEAKRVEEFFKDAELRLKGLSEEDRAKIIDRLNRARELLGGIDALERFKAWKIPEDR